MEGFKNGFKYTDFVKGEVVYVMYSDGSKEKELTKGTVSKIVKEKNADGRDIIRQVHVEIQDGDLYVQKVIAQPVQIAKNIWKKDTPEVEEVKAPEVAEGAEQVWIERAMSVKNPEVQKYLSMGYKFVEKKWDSAKNMYLSLVVKEAQ